MKRILLAVMLSIGVLGFAQNKKNIVKTEIVDKIKNYKPTDLVPYSKDGKKWALMDVKSRKILTDFVLASPNTFNPDISAELYGEYSEESDIIYSDYRLESEVGLIYPVAVAQTAGTDNLPFQVKEKRKIKVDETKYKYILEPILYKEEYYTIATKKDNSDVLINERGEELKGFHFRVIKDSYLCKDKNPNEKIFYVEGFDGKKGFVTISGKKKLYGKLMNEPRSYVIGEGHQSAFGYSLQKDNDDIRKIKKSGIVDTSTQKWLIKPQEKYKIYSILYTSSEKIKKYDETDRNKATIYFLATDKSGQRFVLDIKGNSILPKE
jgi:hypothetical protein